ncbi:cystatin-A-like [Aquarana catesbeiana]|uniref:cystatin-A-like n=1 Tax=Aquarana catesbeiana TaxID=8400 RepID=UPI003CC99460
MPWCGGLGEVKPSNQAVQVICDLFKAEIEQKSGKNFVTYEAVEYKTQLVAGVNFFVKIHVGAEQYIHLRIYWELPFEEDGISLTAFQLGKTKEEEIVHFEPDDD